MRELKRVKRERERGREGESNREKVRERGEKGLLCVNRYKFFPSTTVGAEGDRRHVCQPLQRTTGTVRY